jgi:PAS domain S-box-containing protein
MTRMTKRPAEMKDEMTAHAPVDGVDWTRESVLKGTHDLEGQLRASEERFQTAFYSSPMAMAITTLAEGRYVDVNEAFERQMGYGRTELVGRTTLELNVWPTPADRAAMIARLQRERTLRDQNTQFRTKSGRLITTLYTVTLISIAGQPCVLAAIEDITAQKQAEDALRASESKFRWLAETTLCGIFMYRRDGTFCYFNPQVETFTGYSSQELRSMTVWDLIHPDSRDLVRTRAEARWRGEAVPVRYQFKLATKDGDARWIDFTATPTVFDGEPAILGTAFDITASKRHEQEAKEHTAFLQALIANSPFGILVGGRDHRLRFCNPAFERIFLYSEDEVVGKEPDELVGVPEDADAAEYSRRVMSGQTVHATALRRRKDGSKVNVDFYAMPLIVGDAFVGCVGIYQDITERVESEAKLRALRDRLTRVQDDERARIARELHDDLGQRLALLTIQLSEVQQASLDMAPSLAEQLDTSRKLCEEICIEANLLSHRLHPSRLAHIGLANALSRLCDEFAQQGSMEIDFHHDEIPDLPSEVTTCLYRVAQEAIRNAEKHSGSRRVRVELAARSDAITLCVSDSGLGFAATSAEGSTGLGLVSMAERLRSVGGALSVQSEVNRGTHIEASIPMPPHAQANSVATTGN